MTGIKQRTERRTHLSSTELILIRHGETAWNRARRIQGSIDIPLSPVGEAQARAAARRLVTERIDALWSSDLSRARQTAEPIAHALGLTPTVDARLRERAYGDFEGRDHDTLARDFAEAYAQLKSRDPAFALPGGGESLAAFHARSHEVLSEIARRHAGQRIAIVTHGGVLDCAWRIGAGLPLDLPRRVELLNASLNRLRLEEGRWSVAGWADVAHLDASLDEVDNGLADRIRRPA